MKLLFPLLLLLSMLGAQSSVAVTDIVEVKKAANYEGKLLDYQYGKLVVIELASGERVEVPWQKVKRIKFRATAAEKGPVPELSVDTQAVNAQLPARNWYHQVSGHVGLGKSTASRFGGTQDITTVGLGVAYHHVRQLAFLDYGVGAEFELMSQFRNESMLSGTVFLEAPLLRKRVYPYVRMLGGVGVLVGSKGFNTIESRKPGGVLHPSVGVNFGPKPGKWGTLALDVGYRFSTVEFSATNDSFDLIERRVNYRRLILRTSMRF